MELRQLEYLVAVAEEASFTRAAQRVHISQSGVSAQVRQLEHDLGATLFDRSGRTATLTEAGRAAVKYAKEPLASAAAVRQAVNEVTGLLSGRLTVGMVTACTITALFDALAAFHRAHPGVTITLLEDNSADLAEHTRSGALDVALIGAAGGPPSGLASLPVVSERLVAAVPPGHQLSERTRLTLAALSGFPLICMPQGTGIRTVFDQSCAAAGIRLDVDLPAPRAVRTRRRSRGPPLRAPNNIPARPRSCRRSRSDARKRRRKVRRPSLPIKVVKPIGCRTCSTGHHSRRPRSRAVEPSGRCVRRNGRPDTRSSRSIRSRSTSPA